MYNSWDEVYRASSCFFSLSPSYGEAEDGGIQFAALLRPWPFLHEFCCEFIEFCVDFSRWLFQRGGPHFKQKSKTRRTPGTSVTQLVWSKQFVALLVSMRAGGGSSQAACTLRIVRLGICIKVLGICRTYRIDAFFHTPLYMMCVYMFVHFRVFVSCFIFHFSYSSFYIVFGGTNYGRVCSWQFSQPADSYQGTTIVTRISALRMLS